MELSDTQFRGLVGATGVLFVVLLLFLRFSYDFDLPKKPPKPRVASAEEVIKKVENSEHGYISQVKKDAKFLGVADVPDLDTMAGYFDYQIETRPLTIRPKKGKDTIQVLGLKLKVAVEKIRGSPRRQMILEVENTTDNYLAYRIETRPSKGTRACHQKKSLRHNAIAIAPKGVEVRSECLYRSGWRLEITKVETVEVPELSYLYVSTLQASQIGIDRRHSKGHQAAEGTICQMLLPARVRREIEDGKIAWVDLIDFYARHPCKIYKFPAGYRAVRKGKRISLPAVDPE